jgi:hypothetical protein
MVTREEALQLTHGDEIHEEGCLRITGPRGGVTERITRWRVSGQCQTWKTRPDHFRVPIKFGMYESSTLDHHNAYLCHLASKCPLRAHPETCKHGQYGDCGECVQDRNP